MVLRKILYGIFGFVLGFFIAGAFFMSELKALDDVAAAGFDVQAMEPTLPEGYGKLVAVSDMTMYFQADNGNIYIVRPRTNNVFDSRVTLIKRGQ